MSAGETARFNLALLEEVQDILLSNKRKDLNNVKGQLFIFSHKEYYDYLVAKLQVEEFGYTEEQAKELAQQSTDKFKKLLQGVENAANAALEPKRITSLKNWKQDLLKGRVPGAPYTKITPGTHTIYLVENYAKVSAVKKKAGEALETDTKEAGKTVRKEVITGRIRKGTTAEDFEGFQLGHGEFGVAVSGTKILAAQRILAKLTGKGSTKVQREILRAKGTLKTTSLLQARQVVDSDGNFIKSFIPFISSETTEQNQKTKKIEEDAVKDVTKAVEGLIDELSESEIINMEGSPSIKQAVTATIKHNFAKQKNLKTSGPTKPKRVVKSKSRSKKTVKSKYDRKAQIAAGALAPESISSKRRSSGQGRGGAELLGLFNRDLNKVLQQNMTSPRLNYRTGRFADSVKVVDVNTTAKGYPSFGYTYDKFPYQTFEPGYAQGSQQRDPRKLIDASMREIATQYALGRFFTRRL